VLDLNLIIELLLMMSEIRSKDIVTYLRKTQDARKILASLERGFNTLNDIESDTGLNNRIIMKVISKLQSFSLVSSYYDKIYRYSLTDESNNFREEFYRL
jgi:predicted transcriptional regulator